MANTETIEIQPVGITYDSPERGAFIQNAYSLIPNDWKIREGFGRVYSYNTSYNEVSYNGNITPTDYGYVKHLGSCSFTSAYGNRQILSLHIAAISSLNRDGADGATNTENVINAEVRGVVAEASYQYVVSIYDIDTNRHYEQVIGGKTSEVEDIIPMEQQTGFYDRDLLLQSNTKVFPINPDADEHFYWAELNSPTSGDTIYFGTNLLGLYAYRPIVFDAPPDTQVETTLLGAYNYTMGGMMGRCGWSETSFIEKTTAGEGILEGLIYLNQTEFPVPTDITAINNRLCLAYERTIYFTDEFNGGAIIADNLLEIPTDRTITGISEINGVLLVFTQNETYLYQPSVGTQIQTAGRLIKMNSNWGCLNARAKIKAEDLLYWCDETGIYVSDGTRIEDIADPIRPIFRRFLETPLTDYPRQTPNGYTDSGALQFQSKIKLDWKQLGNLHFAKNPLEQLVFIVLPEQKFAFVIDAKKMFSTWSWSFRGTLEGNRAGEETHYITESSLLSDDFALVDNGDDLFIVDLERKEIRVGAMPISGGQQVYRAERVVNVYRWKTGGALDFDTTYHEDKKAYANSLRVLQNPEDKLNYFAIGKPVVSYDGIRTDYGNIYGNHNSILPEQPWFLVPFGVATDGLNSITSISVVLNFDDDYWQVATYNDFAANDRLDVIWHPNRLITTPGFGYSPAVPAVGSRLLLTAPNEITIEFNGAVGPSTFGNFLNVSNQFQVLFWLPMTLKQFVNNSTLGQGWSIVSAQINASNCVVLATEAGSKERDTGTYGSGASLAQPVEWIIQSQPLQGDKGEQIKARGGFVDVFSHGPYPTRGDRVDDRGLINVMVSSDYNNYQGQVVDFTQVPPSIQDGLINNETGLVDVRDISAGEFVSTAGLLQPKVFNNTAATYANLNYVPPATMGGTILIDGEDNYPTSFSTSTKGTSIFITLYGYCADIANSLIIKKLTGAYRATSDKRRRWKNQQGEN